MLLLVKILIIFLASSETTEAKDLKEEEDDDENTVIIFGYPKEDTAEEFKGGESTLIAPRDESRFRTDTILKNNPLIDGLESDHTSGAGFVLPKLRAEDFSYTDIFVENLRLFDPYMGFPFAQELDLKAFGALEIHQGVAPAEIPVTSPIGVLRYRMTGPKEGNRYSLGLDGGMPYGFAEWASVTSVQPPNSDIYKLFARTHQTDGKYTFYSDEGTPYNASDDEYKTRENNDRRDDFVSIYGQTPRGPMRYSFLGWGFRSNHGVSSYLPHVPNQTREGRSSLGGIAGALFSPHEKDPKKGYVGIQLSHTQDQRTIQDPESEYLFATKKSALKAQSSKVHLSGFFHPQWPWPVEWFLNGAYGHYRAELALDGIKKNSLKEDVWDSYVGARSCVYHAIFCLEPKFSLDQHQAFTGEEGSAEKKNLGTYGAALRNWAWLPWRVGMIYTQWGLQKRPATLLEQFGNGSTIKPSDSLEPETLRHKEIGAVLYGEPARAAGPPPATHLMFQWFQDLSEDKVVFLPVNASVSQAQNLRKASVSGFKVQGNWELSPVLLSAGTSLMFPYDLSQENRRLLPDTPQRQHHLSAAYLHPYFSTRWAAHYRSSVFRDLANSTEKPGVWTHDASADVRIKVVPRQELSLSLMVYNVFNVMAVDLQDAQQEVIGRTAFSDLNGQPLPGRHWQGSVVYHF